MRLLAAVFACQLLAGVAYEARAQNIPPKGSDATFDVATWNIEWFGSTSNGPSDETGQLNNVARVIEESDIDLWAVQEIDDADHFERLLDVLGSDYDGVLGTASTNFKLGFIYKRNVVQPVQVSDAWLSQFEDDFAGRPPLLMLADIVFTDTTVELYVVSLHMKCCGGEDDFAQRSQGSTAMKNRLDALHASDPFIILGDFNDELRQSISGSNPSPYDNFLSDPEDYQFTSLPLEEADKETWCGNSTCTSGSHLDHILITNELFDAYVDGSTDRYEQLLDIDRYVSTTSDHLPVYASFSFSTDTAIQDQPLHGFSLDSIHPNPLSQTGTIRFTLAKPTWTAIELYDVLGRRARTIDHSLRMAGPHRVELSTTDLPSGTYFLRLTAQERISVRPLIIAR